MKVRLGLGDAVRFWVGWGVVTSSLLVLVSGSHRWNPYRLIVSRSVMLPKTIDSIMAMMTASFQLNLNLLIRHIS